MKYREPKRTFEKSGEVLPKTSYFIPLEGVSNTDNPDIKTMVNLGAIFFHFRPQAERQDDVFQIFLREIEKEPTYIAILLSFQRYRNKIRFPFSHFQALWQLNQSKPMEKRRPRSFPSPPMCRFAKKRFKPLKTRTHDEKRAPRWSANG